MKKFKVEVDVLNELWVEKSSLEYLETNVKVLETFEAWDIRTKDIVSIFRGLVIIFSIGKILLLAILELDNEFGAGYWARYREKYDR